MNCSAKKHIKVAGILYLHNITLKRLTEPPILHREIFRNICGEEYLPNVLLVLTMCENTDSKSRMVNEEHMMKYWKKTIGEKDRVYCHYGTTESAWEILKVVGVSLQIFG